jgi:hypothetical protein
VRTTVAIVILLVVASASAHAETPWEAYVRSPSPAAAAAVRTAAYSVADPDYQKFESDLPVLENEVAAGDAESTKLAARLLVQFRNAAAIAELLDAILGRSIRSNPIAYLRATSGDARCPGAFPTGDLYVDRDDARVAEARARANALERVDIPELQKHRDVCLRALSSAIRPQT